MAQYHVAVLDIGKTNKKLFIYDDQLNCLNPDEEGAKFDPVEWNGLLCDDMASIYEWMMEGLAEAADRYEDIRAISVSTHGATLTLLGEGEDEIFPGDGGLVFPVISYENDPGPQWEERFYEDVGMSPTEAQRSTATAPFHWFLNTGRQVHYLQKSMPDRFARVTSILMFSQYITYLLTGRKGVEPTHIGCHNFMLDADGESYSLIAERLGVAEKLPDLPLRDTWEALGTVSPEVAARTGLAPDCVVNMGVHDSNAALVPYFASGMEDFVVHDSGTWFVTMSPTESAEFQDNELGKDVFFNRSVYNKPIKTNIFHGGAEFEFFCDHVLRGHPRPDGIDLDVLKHIIGGRHAFSLPTISLGSGLFPDSVSRLRGLDVVFQDSVHAWHTVDIGLAMQGYLAIAMAAGEEVKQVFIEGNLGRHNPVDRSVIASMLPDADVYYGTMGGAPFGAAILGVATAEGVRPEDLGDRFEMELTPVPPLDLDREDLQTYLDCFVKLAGQ
jgi:hypothetical protein